MSMKIKSNSENCSRYFIILVITLLAQLQCCRSEDMKGSNKTQEFHTNQIEDTIITNQESNSQVNHKQISPNSKDARILTVKNQDIDESWNYSNDIINQLEIKCEPMNCALNCCDQDGKCPTENSNCFFYKCNNSMCQKGGCCIKGVCRSESDCKEARTCRYIAIGLVLLFAIIIITFKTKIEKYFKDRSIYNQDEFTQNNNLQPEFNVLNQYQNDQQQNQKFSQLKPDTQENTKRKKTHDENDTSNIIESNKKKEFNYKNVFTQNANNDAYNLNRDSQITIQPPITNSSSIAHKIPRGISDIYKPKFV